MQKVAAVVRSPFLDLNIGRLPCQAVDQVALPVVGDRHDVVTLKRLCLADKIAASPATSAPTSFRCWPINDVPTLPSGKGYPVRLRGAAVNDQPCVRFALRSFAECPDAPLRRPSAVDGAGVERITGQSSGPPARSPSRLGLIGVQRGQPWIRKDRGAHVSAFQNKKGSARRE